MFRKKRSMSSVAAQYSRYKKVQGGLPRADRFYTSCVCLIYLAFWLAFFLFLLIALPKYIEPTSKERALLAATCTVEDVHLAVYPSVKHVKFLPADPPKLLACSLDDCPSTDQLCGFGACVQMRVNSSRSDTTVEVGMPRLSTLSDFERLTSEAEGFDGYSRTETVSFMRDDFLIFGVSTEAELERAFAEFSASQPLAMPVLKTFASYEELEPYGSCTFVDCRATAEEAWLAANVTSTLYNQGDSAECWLHEPTSSGQTLASEIAFYLRGVDELTATDSPRNVLPAVFRLEYSLVETLLVILSFTIALACSFTLFCFLMCREWLCQFDWARRFQYF